MKFKLDENLSPTLAAGFLAAGHTAHSVLEQALGGASDPRVIEVCRLESRALITLDLDFANIQRYPPARSIPVDAEAVQARKSPARRAAAERYLSGLPKDCRARVLLNEAFAETKSEARANALTDADIDAELEAWCAERKTRSSLSTPRRLSRPLSETTSLADDESEKRRSSKRAPTLVNGKVTQKRSARLKVSLRPGVPLRTRAEPR